MIRLTSGIFRGRTLKTAPGLETRPTQAKLRQALFNSLQMEIPDAKVLDLFSGSGALGFEALSRDAASVVFVESSPVALKVLKENAVTLQLSPPRVEILGQKLPDGVSRLLKWAPFDLVLADPPYAEGWELRLLNEFPWEQLLTVGGKFCLEWGTQKSQVDQLPDETPFLKKIREKEYGDSKLTHFERFQ